MCEFQVGDMIVCINDTPDIGMCPHPVIPDMNGLMRGEIYTVRELYIETRNVKNPDGEICVKLVEIVRMPILPWQPETGYFAQRFRPVKKTSIEVFQQILEKPPTIRELLDA